MRRLVSLASLLPALLATACRTPRIVDGDPVARARRAPTTWLREAGYDARGLQRYLYCRPTISGDPTNVERAEALEQVVAPYDAALDAAARDRRTARFRAALGRTTP